MNSSSQRVPRLTSTGQSVGRAPASVQGALSPVDGFVLSRIDATTSDEDLVSLTGLSESAIADSLAKLLSLGLIEYPHTGTAHSFSGPGSTASPFAQTIPPPSLSSSGEVASAAASTAAAGGTAGGTAASSYAGPPTAPSASPSPPPSVRSNTDFAVDATVDLDPDHQREIFTLHAKVDTADHYELLGVDRDADKKTIKRAYMKLAAQFHPDRFFRKNLGALKGKMEVCFGKLTVAHDVLTSAQRADYDAYLETRDRGRSVDRILEQHILQQEELQQHLTSAHAPIGPSRFAAPASPASPAIGTAASPSSRETPTSDGPRASAKAASGPSPAPTSAGPKSPAPAPDSHANANASGFASAQDSASVSSRRDIAAGSREAFAKRLLGSQRSSHRPPSSAIVPTVRGESPPPSTAPVRSETRTKTTPDTGPTQATLDAMAAIERNYRARVAANPPDEAERYLESAQKAAAAGDWVMAANNYRLAKLLRPDDKAVAEGLERVQRAADHILADTFRTQGEYEEKQGRYRDAASSWEKVSRARPADAFARDRVAANLIASAGDLHLAVAHASHAVGLDPSKVEYRLTLARAYMAARLHTSARSTLESALKIAPNDPDLLSLLKSLP